MTESLRNRIIAILGTDLDRWFTIADMVRCITGPPSKTLRASQTVMSDNLTSEALKMVQKGVLVREAGVGPRGGYGYRLSDREKSKLKAPVSKFALIHQDPFQ